jgi:hypothetical protein
MKFALNQLPDEIYFHIYEIDRAIFGDLEEESRQNMLALYKGGAVEITHDDYCVLYVIEKGEVGFDWFCEKMKGFEIKS